MLRLRPSGDVAVLLLLVVVGAASVSRAGDAQPVVETVKVPRPGGADLEASLHRPAKSNACAVVVAPGQGGGRERPVTKRAAEALASTGFTVVRFDWSYFTAHGQPSEDLGAEAADLDAALAYARALPGVQRVIVAGKSLGTLATAVLLRTKTTGIAGLVMLTPALTRGDPVGTPFPGVEQLFQTKIPTLMLAGDRDPLCPLPLLYRLAEKAEVPPRIVVVPGDHGLGLGRGAEAESEESLAFATAAVSLWARRFAASEGGPR